jgi:transcriptional regulator of acetoin/glycerol metabolism
MSDDFLQSLMAYRWPGNVRELRNVIYRAVILSDDLTLTCDLLPEEIVRKSSNNEEYRGFSLEEVDKAHIEKVMTMVNGNKVEAANILSIGLTTLYRKIQEYNLDGNYVYTIQRGRSEQENITSL